MHTLNDFAAAGLILLLYGAPIVFAFIFARREPPANPPHSEWGGPE